MTDTTQAQAQQPAEVAPAVPAAPATRDQIRAKILGAKAKVDTTELYGAQVEIRQPSLDVIMDARQAIFNGDSDLKTQTIDVLINYVFVPGTTEHVFEEADREALLELPFDNDLNKLSEKINSLMGLNAKVIDQAIEDNSKSTAE